MHYFRNRLNRAPETLAEMIEINKTLPEDRKWMLLSVGNSICHMYPTEFCPRGEFNLKIVSYNGLWEGVYNENGILLTEYNDPKNMGTYNYCSPLNWLGHAAKDYKPYLLYSNTETLKFPNLPFDLGSEFENEDTYNGNDMAQKYRGAFISIWEGKVEN